MLRFNTLFLSSTLRIYSLIFSLMSFLSIAEIAIASEIATPEITILPPPNWVEIRPLTLNTQIPLDDLSDGIYYRLLDTQIDISASGDRSHYSRFAETVVNKAGVDANSQINISYDPSYQQLVFHHLTIHRNEQQLDKLTSSKISTFHNENDLQAQMYNGELTLNILIDDLREGDTIDYSFTRYGANPVYKKIFSYSRNTNWSVPVEQQYIRVLWGKSQPLYINTRNLAPDIKTTKHNKFIDYQVHLNNEKHLHIASETPSWYDPYGQVFFSELKTWQEVVNWAEPLYHFTDVHAEVKKIAAEIKKQTNNTAQQISKALAYTQNEIRYVGLEMGTNSHLPTPAHETVNLRYGDCKDKAVLLISILKALGIKAYPALVHTEETKLLNDKPPAVNLFNHVIVTLEFNNKRYWLDPTMSYQMGELNTIFQPDFGYALILKEGEKALTPMTAKEHNSSSHIKEFYVLPEKITDVVKFKVTSEFLGDKAQRKFNQIEQEGLKELSNSYEVYYQGIHNKLKALSEVIIESDKANGLLKLNENYQIENIWTKADNGYEIDFYPQDIRDAIFKPKQVVRQSPLVFNYPNNIKNTITIKFNETDWHFDHKTFVENNDYFNYQSKVKFTHNTLTLSYSYQAKTDHIPQNKIDDYLAARDKVLDDAYYGIIKYFDEDLTAKAEQESENELGFFELLNDYVENNVKNNPNNNISNPPETAANIATNSDTDSNTQKNLNDALTENSEVKSQIPESSSSIETTLTTKQQSTVIANKLEIKQWLIAITIIYLAAILFIIISWQKESRQRPDFKEAKFYTLSPFKFTLISISSFGLYSVYWAYRNWQAIKLTQKSAIMPLFRALFTVLWFYPLQRFLQNDSKKRWQKNSVISNTFAVVFALIYLTVIVMVIYQYHYFWLVALLVSTLLFIPMIEYIATVNKTDSAAYIYNSKWHFRHTVCVLLFIPVFTFLSAQHFNIIPQPRIIHGAELLSKDTKFLHQQQLMTLDDDVIYFYSDALFSISNDGIGFTNNRVFSYYLDENNQLQKNVVLLKNIAKIEVDFSTDNFNYTVVKITPKNAKPFSIFISANRKLDKVFVKQLKVIWQEQYFEKQSFLQDDLFNKAE